MTVAGLNSLNWHLSWQTIASSEIATALQQHFQDLYDDAYIRSGRRFATWSE